MPYLKTGGRNIWAEVFDTVADMNLWLQNPQNTAKLRPGDLLLIREKDVPDYWWDGTQALVSEGEKVDLSGYYTSSQVDAKLTPITTGLSEAKEDITALQSAVERKINQRGSFQLGNTYNTDDVVKHEGVEYIAVMDGVVLPPPSPGWDEYRHGITEHSQLTGLDYGSSGHTGFASLETLSETGSITLTNSLAYPFNNSQATITFQTSRQNSGYEVVLEPEVTPQNKGRIGELCVSDKLLNGCKLAYTGSAGSVTVRYRILGGMN